MVPFCEWLGTRAWREGFGALGGTFGRAAIKATGLWPRAHQHNFRKPSDVRSRMITDQKNRTLPFYKTQATHRLCWTASSVHGLVSEAKKAELTSSTASCKISLRFFSPPEKPSLTLRFRKVGSMFSSSSCS
ncbi:hypothetical protein Vretimale_9629 [Volvox reticuliferus]|uniref:Uncharacterized protein n=1 Tax=Volvox reticuliferus TaxID=1737510 RepID=A0A8J4GDR3_9CHLO|nr:hypothetical protein Vretimale_9629 [Volvox reticuliferus]